MHIDGHGPDIMVIQGSPDRLIQQCAGQAAVHDPWVALVLLKRCEAGGHAAVLQVVEGEP